MSELAAPALPTEEDYRRYDRIWKKVSPEYNPYPEVRAAQSRAQGAAEDNLLTLPGAEANPCCMGSAAESDLEVIQDFLRDELADAQTYRYLAHQSSTQAGRALMRQLSAEETGHVKTLQSVCFLITGGTYPVTVVLPPQPKQLWRDRLRERYHAEACGGFNYERAAEETTDVCLKRIFERLSQDEYRHAEQIRRLLAKLL